MASDVVDRHPAGVPGAVHHERGERKPGVARAAASLEGTAAARLAVADAALQPGSRVDDDPHVDPDGRIPVHVSLDYLLVSHAADADGAADAPLPRRAQHR